MNTTIHIADYIDHTQLRSDATIADITTLCDEAISHAFYAVCVHGAHTHFVSRYLSGHPVKVATTVGFPMGAMHAKAKALEAEQAVQDGAHEIDMVMNIGLLKSRETAKVVQDMSMVKKAVGKDIIVKVIFENALLEEDEKHVACKLAIEAGVDFIKTSTGFTTGAKPGAGATRADILLMLEEVKHTQVKVKAAGGVKDYATAMDYISLGVSRIGTSSGIAIIQGAPVSSDY